MRPALPQLVANSKEPMYLCPSSFSFHMLVKDLINSQEGPLIHRMYSPAMSHVTQLDGTPGGGAAASWGDTCSTSRTAVSPSLVQSSHVLYSHAEDEQVLFPGFLGHFHVGPIHGPDGQGPIQHELHVACP